jgi:hypothetical protein
MVQRGEPKENPPKRLIDVESILKSIGKDSSDLAGRVYFFDDLHHEIEKELGPGQYCLMYNWLRKDELNDYGPVRKAMGLDLMPDLVLPPSAASQTRGGKRTRKKKISRRSRRNLKR